MIRRKPGKYRFTKSKKLVERSADDPDLIFGSTKVFVLGENEWFDPKTSTKYDGPDGQSRHAMYGPSVILCSGTDQWITTEYHVNDPRPWAYVRRMIATQEIEKNVGLVTDEAEVTVKG